MLIIKKDNKVLIASDSLKVIIDYFERQADQVLNKINTPLNIKRYTKKDTPVLLLKSKLSLVEKLEYIEMLLSDVRDCRQGNTENHIKGLHFLSSVYTVITEE